MELLAHGLAGFAVVGLVYQHLRLRSELEVLQRHVGQVLTSSALRDLHARLTELERLWRIAKENPGCIRELAVEALKGKD